jgi:nucleotide-binding universal stress UspA family protein
MLKTLLAVDGSTYSDRAVEHVINLAANGLATDVLVLNVQTAAPASARSKRRARAIKDLDASDRAMRSAVSRLRAAGLPFRAYTRFGAPATAILQSQRRGAAITL